MDIHFHSFLRKIGFSEKAVSVYLALLRLGSSQPVQVIARKAHLNRSTTYYVLNELLENGFVSRFFKGKIQHFSGLEPDFLQDFLEQKQRNLQRNLQEFQLLRSQFGNFSSSVTGVPHTEYLEGDQSLSVIFERVFKKASSFCIYRPLEYWMKTPFFSLIDQQIRDVFKRRSPEQKFFFPESEKVRDFFQKIYPKPNPLNFSFFQDGGSFFERECLIYDSSVSFVSFHQKNMFAVTFRDESFATFQRRLFDSLWNLYNAHNDFS